MKRNVLFAIFCFFNLTIVNAQNNFSAVHTKPFKEVLQHTSPNPNGACDTANLELGLNEWDAYYYTYGTNGSSGFAFGVSDLSAFGYSVQEDANYFDESSSGYNYVSGGLAYFAFANSTNQANLDKDVIFKVYDDNGGEPGSVLGSTTLKLSQIQDDVNNGNLTEFRFATPIPLPASKTFYVSIDHSNFSWSGSDHDSIAIVANGDNQSDALAFQYIYVAGSGFVWKAVSDFWG